MNEASAPLPVEPKPGWLKAVGVLNIVCALAMLGFGLGTLALAGPHLREYTPLEFDPALTQDVFNELRRQSVADLTRFEESARSPLDKLRFARAREEMQKVDTNLNGKLDFDRLNADLPWVTRYLWLNLLSGPVVNMLLLASGVALLTAKGWSRTVAIRVAALKIARLAALAVFLCLIVIPRGNDALGLLVRTEFGQAFVRHAMDQQDPAANSVPLPVVRFRPDEFVRIVRAMGYTYAIVGFALSAIYPASTILVLTRPAAVAVGRGGMEVGRPAEGQ
jgi:hypothetical protein